MGCCGGEPREALFSDFPPSRAQMLTEKVLLFVQK